MQNDMTQGSLLASPTGDPIPFDIERDLSPYLGDRVGVMIDRRPWTDPLWGDQDLILRHLGERVTTAHYVLSGAGAPPDPDSSADCVLLLGNGEGWGTCPGWAAWAAGRRAVVLSPAPPRNPSGQYTTIPWGADAHPVPDDHAERVREAGDILVRGGLFGLFQPGLIRDLRLQLADRALWKELAVWCHPDTWRDPGIGIVIRTDRQAAYADTFARMPTATQNAALSVLPRWRAGLPEELTWAEVLRQAVLPDPLSRPPTAAVAAAADGIRQVMAQAPAQDAWQVREWLARWIAASTPALRRLPIYQDARAFLGQEYVAGASE